MKVRLDRGRAMVAFRGRWVWVSRLVLIAWSGEARPPGTPIVFKDGDPANVRPGNLSWGKSRAKGSQSPATGPGAHPSAALVRECLAREKRLRRYHRLLLGRIAAASDEAPASRARGMRAARQPATASRLDFRRAKGPTKPAPSEVVDVAARLGRR